MQGEGVSPETLAALDVSDHSAHWARTQAFLAIVAPFFAGAEAPGCRGAAAAGGGRGWPRAGGRHRRTHPVIVAGSTGSRGTTALLMQAVARLPQGALVLPGFDFDLPRGGLGRAVAMR